MISLSLAETTMLSAILSFRNHLQASMCVDESYADPVLAPALSTADFSWKAAALFLTERNESAAPCLFNETPWRWRRPSAPLKPAFSFLLTAACSKASEFG